MRIVIAEDDRASQKLLRHFIEGFPNCEVVGEVADGEALVKTIVQEEPDLVLVDIGMPHLSGMEAVKSCINLVPGMQVIFITGSDDYAVEAFSLKAVDYILKPVERSRLYEALQRASRAQELQDKPKVSGSKELMIKQQNALLFIPIKEILFVERVDRKSVIHTYRGEYVTYESMTSLKQKLDSVFIECHRSYIINTDNLERVEPQGQSYIGYFMNYDKPAKISKNKLSEVQFYKSL